MFRCKNMLIHKQQTNKGFQIYLFYLKRIITDRLPSLSVSCCHGNSQSEENRFQPHLTEMSNKTRSWHTHQQEALTDTFHIFLLHAARVNGFYTEREKNIQDKRSETMIKKSKKLGESFLFCTGNCPAFHNKTYFVFSVMLLYTQKTQKLLPVEVNEA